MGIRCLEWRGDRLGLLDQRELPLRESWMELTEWSDVRDAIHHMVIRGAPAIGIAAAFGMALAARSGADRLEADAGLRASRPTAVNLFWALDRIAALSTFDPEQVLNEALLIAEEDLQMNLRIGEFGATLLAQGSRVLTICNTGALATGGHGTALGILRTAHAQGKLALTYACETRPRLQGLRLTAWELTREGMPFLSIADAAAGALMGQGMVDAVLAGADRIAANGDTANKLGTLSLAVQAKFFGIPMIIAAPSTTLDSSLPDGTGIPIETRGPEELTTIDGVRVAPEGCPVWNPAFDVTPHDLISYMVTEAGIFSPPFKFLDLNADTSTRT